MTPKIPKKFYYVIDMQSFVWLRLFGITARKDGLIILIGTTSVVKIRKAAIEYLGMRWSFAVVEVNRESITGEIIQHPWVKYTWVVKQEKIIQKEFKLMCYMPVDRVDDAPQEEGEQ